MHIGLAVIDTIKLLVCFSDPLTAILLRMRTRSRKHLFPGDDGPANAQLKKCGIN